MLRTRFTELLGLDYPIMSAPMAMHSGATIAAAVSNAGGLGTFGAINPGGEHWVREQIAGVRAQTGRPFGVGFITQYIPLLPQNFEAALEGRPPVFVFSFTDPLPYLTKAKETGAIAICQVQTMELARMAVDAGADMLIAQGNEAGGHTGAMNLLPLLCSVIDAYPSVPVLAAGGIASGRSLAAVLAAGADGAVLGTAFLATDEAVEVSAAHKQRIVASDGQDTIYSPIYDIASGGPWPAGIAGRVYRNAFIDEWLGREDELREKRQEIAPTLEEAYKRDDATRMPVYMGQGSGSITAVRPAAEVLRSICEDAGRILAQPITRRDC
jgi:nitronate monooxygenase